jgi:glycosyltransferase involved in cell wall biosynthesis
LVQNYSEFEVIVINDGSSAEHETYYADELKVAAGVARMVTLVRTEHGNGPGYARNYGAAQAHGDFLSFLDDDDQWTDPEYLCRVARVINGNAGPVDLILANQMAFRNGTPVPGVTWIEDLADRLRSVPDGAGAYGVTVPELLRCQAHCHLNTTIIARTFFVDMGGFDEGLRYEEDVDLYLRAIDRARSIKFLPVSVSRHNIPDPVAKTSQSTAASKLSKNLYRMRVFDKAVLFSARSELRCYAMRQRAYTLKHIASEAARIGMLDCALYYAREALMARFTFGWLLAVIMFSIQRLFQYMCNRKRKERLGMEVLGELDM